MSLVQHFQLNDPLHITNKLCVWIEKSLPRPYEMVHNKIGNAHNSNMKRGWHYDVTILDYLLLIYAVSCYQTH